MRVRPRQRRILTQAREQQRDQVERVVEFMRDAGGNHARRLHAIFVLRQIVRRRTGPGWRAGRRRVGDENRDLAVGAQQPLDPHFNGSLAIDSLEARAEVLAVASQQLLRLAQRQRGEPGIADLAVQSREPVQTAERFRIKLVEEWVAQ